MTRCENAQHHLRNGLVVLVSLTRQYVPVDYQEFFIQRIELMEKALEECDCECKDVFVDSSPDA